MWTDREDMRDSVAWLRKEREMATAINADGVIDSNILIDAMNGIVDAVAFWRNNR